ncbi:MAG TPA: DUF1707 and FHA domain-containing protein [Gaiellaceae bacterium]|nr:DUF1707 and FHA domain-containing protein [Gaiellaceae bacterium]
MSAAERERVIRRLRTSCEHDRLSLDTFADRVELAYSATHRGQLAELVADLPDHGRAARAVLGAVTAVSRWTAELEAAWRHARLRRLALPFDGTVVLGRARDCDCILGDPTVSRRHALLRRHGGRWSLSDLGSLNGTWVNGRRAVGEVEVRPGDEVSFGDATFRLAADSLRRSA